MKAPHYIVDAANKRINHLQMVADQHADDILNAKRVLEEAQTQFDAATKELKSLQDWLQSVS